LISSLTTVVVFVDDGHHAQVQQREQGRARVQIALAVRQVGVREQDLRAGQAVLAHLGLVHLRQAHLADRRGRLQLVDFARALGPPQAFRSFGNGAARHHDDLAPRTRLPVDQGRQLTAPLADGRGIEPTTFVGHEAGADLDDDAVCLAQDLGRSCH